MSENCLSIIAAVAQNRMIGRDGQLPWHLSADLKRFKELTMGHAIIMGRKTYDSIGKLLPGRQTVVITRQPDWQLEGAIVCDSFPAAIEATQKDDQPFVIGGASLYHLALPIAKRLYLTRVEADVEGDVEFPSVDWAEWVLSSSDSYHADAKNDYPHRFEVYNRHTAEPR